MLKEIIIIVITLSTLGVAIWTLIETRKTRKINKHQLDQSIEPILDLFVTAPNSNPIGLTCQNSGPMINNAQFCLDNSHCETIYFIYDEQHKISQAFIHLQRLLIPQNEKSIVLTIKYENKIGNTKSQRFIFKIQENKIIRINE